MTNFRKIIAFTATALALLACSDDSSDAAPVNAGGAPGSVAARAQSCLTIDKGAATVVAQGAQPATGSAGQDGGESKSMCDTLYTGCTDEDLAALVPQYECFTQHSTETTDAILAACPATAKLSDACNASIDKAVSPSKGPSGFDGPQACWNACACCMRDLNYAAIYNYNSKAECDFACFWIWWVL